MKMHILRLVELGFYHIAIMIEEHNKMKNDIFCFMKINKHSEFTKKENVNDAINKYHKPYINIYSQKKLSLIEKIIHNNANRLYTKEG